MRDRVAKYVCMRNIGKHTKKIKEKSVFFPRTFSRIGNPTARQNSGVQKKRHSFGGSMGSIRDRSDTLRKKRKRGERPSFSFFSQGVGSRIKIKDPKALESFDQNNAKCKLKIPGELPQ